MITEVAKITGVSEEEILGKSRLRQICDARHLYFLVLQENGFKLAEIARFCERSHATVINGIKSFQKLLDSGDLSMRLWYSLAQKIKR